MKTLGMIGGIGPESTIEYYRHLIAAYRARKPDGSYPPIVINSVNMKTSAGHDRSQRLSHGRSTWWAKFKNWRAPGRSVACWPPIRLILCLMKSAGSRRFHWSASWRRHVKQPGPWG